MFVIFNFIACMYEHQGTVKLFAISEIQNNRSLTVKDSIRISQNYALKVFALTSIL